MPIVCGIHPVLEALSLGSRTIERVVVTKGVRNKRILEVIRKASERGVPLRFEPREALDRAADGERHQGVLAIVAEKGLLSLEELQKTARPPALFMLLDGVEDPRNLGAIIRSVDAAGADGLILPDRHTASLSDAASRTAAGALESVKIARIGNVVQALESLKAKGFWIVGFDGSGKERWDAIDYKRPVVLVLGGEGKGIRRLVKEHCDHIVSLPVFGQVSSLNVSVAAGIALYEAVRQRGTVPTLARPIPPRALVAKKRVVIGPPPEDREEDPGAKRRAAAIASLGVLAEPVRVARPEIPLSGVTPAAASVATDGVPSSLLDSDGAEPNVAEASLEAIESDDGGGPDDETRAARATEAPDEGVDEEDDHDEDGGEEEGADDHGRDDDDDDRDDGDEEDGEDEGDEDNEDDEEGDDEEEDDEEDDQDGEGDEDGEDVEDEDKGDASSDLAAPFMPEDNSGGGEVTWGSEKELHAHRPRREGERRFGNNGGRRSGRPNDRKKRPAPQGGGATPPGPRPQGQAPSGGREQNREKNSNQRQQRRGPDRPREPRPPQEGGPGGPPQSGRENERPMPEGEAPSESSAPQNGGESRGPDQARDPNRPNQGRRRNRRRRGGRGRSGEGERPAGDPNAPQGPPREGQREGRNEPRDRGPRPQGQPRPQGETPAGGGEPPPSGDRQPRESGTGGEQSRRDRDRRRRRRRGGRGPGGGQSGGPGGGQSGGGGQGGSNESGGGGSDQGGSSGGSGSPPSGGAPSE